MGIIVGLLLPDPIIFFLDRVKLALHSHLIFDFFIIKNLGELSLKAYQVMTCLNPQGSLSTNRDTYLSLTNKIHISKVECELTFLRYESRRLTWHLIFSL